MIEPTTIKEVVEDLEEVEEMLRVIRDSLERISEPLNKSDPEFYKREALNLINMSMSAAEEARSWIK